MASDSMIDRYLEVLRGNVAWYREAEDFVAEVEDHLRSAVVGMRAEGFDAGEAERITLERFGDPGLVAKAFATSARGGLALPTTVTQRAGTLAIISAYAWPVVVGAWWVGGLLEPWGSVTRNITAIFWVLGWFTAMGLGVVLLSISAALGKRHGGLGPVGRVATVCIGCAALAIVSAWVFMVWGALMSIGTSLLAIALFRHRLAPRWSVAAFGGSFVFGGIVWAALRIATRSLHQWGELYGEYWIANMTGLTVACLLLSLGLLGIGRWLRSEDPAQLATEPLTVT